MQHRPVEHRLRLGAGHVGHVAGEEDQGGAFSGREAVGDAAAIGKGL